MREYEPKKVVDDLNPTEDGEASEETHCASNQAQLSLSCHLGGEFFHKYVYNFVLSHCVHRYHLKVGHLYVPLNLVIGGRIKEDVHLLQRSLGVNVDAIFWVKLHVLDIVFFVSLVLFPERYMSCLLSFHGGGIHLMKVWQLVNAIRA